MRTRKSPAFLLLALVVTVPAVLHAAPQRWSVLMMGNPAGFLSVERHGAAYDTHFEYNDRGRGPSIDSHLELAADGTPVRLTNSGVEYFKGTVSEEFVVETGRARSGNELMKVQGLVEVFQMFMKEIVIGSFRQIFGFTGPHA